MSKNVKHPKPLLLTRINFNQRKDKLLHPLYSVEWNFESIPKIQRYNGYISIPKIQWCNRSSFGNG